MVYYHMTPEKNVKRIQKEGLVPGSSRSLSSTAEREAVGDAVFLARCTEEARMQLDLFGGDEPGLKIRNWAMFEVTLPDGFSLLEDYEGYLYATRPIPPDCLRLVYTDTAWRKKVLEEYGHDYGKIKDEV